MSYQLLENDLMLFLMCILSIGVINYTQPNLIPDNLLRNLVQIIQSNKFRISLVIYPLILDMISLLIFKYKKKKLLIFVLLLVIPVIPHIDSWISIFCGIILSSNFLTDYLNPGTLTLTSIVERNIIRQLVCVMFFNTPVTW